MIQIRKIDGRAVERVREIAAPSFPRLWTVEEFVYFLDNASGVCLGAFESGRLVGYLIALVAIDELDVASVAVDPGRRRQGIAELLLREALKGKGLNKAFLEVSVENKPAIGLYEKVGFKQVGVRKKYYEGKHDALLMAMNFRL